MARWDKDDSRCELARYVVRVRRVGRNFKKEIMCSIPMDVRCCFIFFSSANVKEGYGKMVTMVQMDPIFLNRQEAVVLAWQQPYPPHPDQASMTLHGTFSLAGRNLNNQKSFDAFFILFTQLAFPNSWWPRIGYDAKPVQQWINARGTLPSRLWQSILNKDQAAGCKL